MDWIEPRLTKRDFDWLDIARWLLLAEFVVLFISTSLVSLFEILLLVALVGCLFKYRFQLLAALSQPMVIMLIAFAVMVVLGAFYGSAPWSDTLDAMKGWRKLLLLPLAAALFAEPAWKQRLTLALILTALCGMLFSYLLLLGGKGPIVIHNHATQGIFFASAAFAILVTITSSVYAGGPLLRFGLGTGAVLLVLNIVFFTPGRGGYMVLLVLALFFAMSMFKGWWRIALTVALPLTLILLLALSPTARQRLEQGIDEMRNYRQATESSSMGIRVLMWSNTLQLIREQPLLGYGLGGLREAYGRRVEGLGGGQGVVINDPHNQFLMITAEHGLVGLLLFWGFLGACFFRQKVAPLPRRLGLGILLAWCASSLFAGHFSTWAEGRFIMIWIGGQLAMLPPAFDLLRAGGGGRSRIR